MPLLPGFHFGPIDPPGYKQVERYFCVQIATRIINFEYFSFKAILYNEKRRTFYFELLTFKMVVTR